MPRPRKQKPAAAGASTDNTDQKPAAAPNQPPFLNIASEIGGTFLKTQHRVITRVMTNEDRMDAAEHQAQVAHQMEQAELEEAEAQAEAVAAKKLLDGARQRAREAEKKQKEAGKELKVLAFEVETGMRKIGILCNLTLTTGNEVVATDANTGEEVERWTASREEIESAVGKSSAIVASGKGKQEPPTRSEQLEVDPDKPPGAAAPPPAAGGDSSTAKPNPEQEDVLISVVEGAYGKLKGALRNGMDEVPFPNTDADDQPFQVVWMRKQVSVVEELVAEDRPAFQFDGQRLYTVVPRWVASRLRTVAEAQPKLELRQEEARPQPRAQVQAEDRF